MAPVVATLARHPIACPLRRGMPKGKFTFADRFLSQESDVSTPITEMVVNSIITNIRDGQRIAVEQETEVRGIAWDGGYGIRTVDVSADGGRTWATAELGADLGRFSLHTWQIAARPAKAGEYPVMARATNGRVRSRPAS